MGVGWGSAHSHTGLSSVFGNLLWYTRCIGWGLPNREASSPVCEAFSFGELSMTKSFNRTAVYAVFNQADKSSVSFAEQLLALGIGSRADARPLAMDWASKKYNVALKEGQRGTTFVKVDTDAERAMNRVLQLQCCASCSACGWISHRYAAHVVHLRSESHLVARIHR